MSCSAVRSAVWRDEKSLGRVSAEARVQSGSLCWARPRRWPEARTWAGSRVSERGGYQGTRSKRSRGADNLQRTPVG